MEITKKQALTNLDTLRHYASDIVGSNFQVGLIDEIVDYVGVCPSNVTIKPGAVHFSPNYEQSDPTGRGQHEPGAKLDRGKVRAALVGRDFGRALRLVAEVSTYGADKYTPQGWASVPDGRERYIDAAFRHLFALRGPESVTEAKDDESGLAHLAHAAWNLLAVLELSEREKEKRGA